MDISIDMVKELVENKIDFVKRMNLKAVELSRGHVRLVAPLEGNENHIGSMYAGALFTLAEIPGGALFLTTFDTSRYYPIVKEMTIRFLRPARSDVSIDITISDEEVRRIQDQAADSGKADYVLEGAITDVSGDVVATMSAVYQLRSVGT